jgi:cold shock CspA family protein
MHEDIYVAIRDSFAVARRQLEDHARKQRGDIKQHEVPVHGSVSRVIAEEDHGFVALPDGREVYFHRNAVVDGGFAALKVGGEVRIEHATCESEKGAQATTSGRSASIILSTAERPARSRRCEARPRRTHARKASVDIIETYPNH